MLTESLENKYPDQLADRRRHERVSLRSGTFAGCSPNVGEVVDISLGGISFSYVEFGGDRSPSSNFILCGTDGCCVEDLSYAVVSDKVFHNSSALSHIVTKLRRIKFTDLTEDQIRMLQDFIDMNRDN
nr:PilZ domain-containing protein [Desulfobulbaceae bacterium]